MKNQNNNINKQIAFLIVFLVILLNSDFCFAQKKAKPIEIDWEILGDVKFRTEYNPDFDLEYKKPTFGISVENMEDKEVQITGYIFPFDLEGNYYILSKFPYNACFFCSKDGSVGPQTVMELKMTEKYDWFQMDDIVTFKGMLELNRNDMNQLYYTLRGATVVGR